MAKTHPIHSSSPSLEDCSACHALPTASARFEVFSWMAEGREAIADPISELATQAKLVSDDAVALDVDVGQVVQEAAAAANEH